MYSITFFISKYEMANILLPPWQKEVRFLLAFVLSVNEQHQPKSYEQIAMKCYGEVWAGTRTN